MIHQPKHPGQMVKSLCLDPLHLSVTQAAKALDVARPTLSRLINGHASISPEMALRLSIVFNTAEEFWINLQAQYDVYQIKKQRKSLHLKPFRVANQLAMQGKAY